MNHLKRLIGIGITVSVFSPVSAQTVPDSGVLQQQIERERELELPRRLAPERPAQPAEMRPSGGIVLHVEQFRFAGNTLLSNDELQAVVAEYRGQRLDFAQLQGVAAKVAEAYRAKGWVARVYLPDQDIDDPEHASLVIQIVEAVFGKVLVEGEQARVDPDLIQAIVTTAQPSGETLNADAIDRSLLLIDDLPGVTVTGALQAGAAESETDLVVTTAPEPLASGYVLMDNTGSRSTGDWRANGTVYLNGLLGAGDRIGVNLIHSEGSDYGRIEGSVPVGSAGWRIGANASHLKYDLVGSSFAALNASGSSTIFGLVANYPVVRSRLQNLYLGVASDFKSFDNKSAGVVSSNYDIRDFHVSLYGNQFDNFGGGGANSFVLSLHYGVQDLGTLDAGETKPSLDGDFTKVRYNASRQQVLTDELSLFAALSGQWTDQDLDTAERFYLGGANGVRAYPSGEGSGAAGEMVNLELRWRLPQGVTVAGFYDWGRIRNYDTSPDYSLKGAGLYASWQSEQGINLSATWARRIGSNPNPTATGRDQDGSLIKNRFWLTAGLSF